MRLAIKPHRFGDRKNAFGFIRLLLASLVIVSHTPELSQGNRSHEPLAMLFGPDVSFGSLAVDGFFLISGYLITASYLSSFNIFVYLKKRVTRIYPAFIVCVIVSVFIVAPLGGGAYSHGPSGTIAGVVARCVLLSPPHVDGVFAGTFYPLLNGATWTIQYEFACYLLIIAFGVFGLFRRPKAMLAIAAILLTASSIAPYGSAGFIRNTPLHYYLLEGSGRDLCRLFGMFTAGSCFSLYQRRITVNAVWATASLLVVAVCLPHILLRDLGIAVAGGYTLFATASLLGGTPIARINDKNDISYGLYLYAWPIEKLLFWWGLSGSLVVAGLSTWVLAALAGALSWFVIEKPALRYVRSR